ncbi:MAG TPA: hypothetical protein VL463_11540 [Kofleriaceae bacterium]|nr:hypothetical protein [Kofleriaceae bacterium]
MRRALLFVTIAACGAWACGSRSSGSSLPKAGGEADDGAGQLASASSQILMGGDDDGGGFAPEHRANNYDQYSEYGAYGYGGGMYGGGAYGGGAYGGYLYGGYVPYASMANPPQVAPNPYSGIGVTDGGSITGTIRWPHAPPAPASLALSCGATANPTLAIARGGVADTVVYLARVDHGRAVPVATRTIQVGGTVERHGCAFEPIVQVATPLPAPLTVINADAGRVSVLIGKDTKLALDEGTSRTTPLVSGPMRVADDAGAIVPAWVVGVSHPYYTLTDGEGRFRIDDVPAGSYELVAWHAPVVTGVKDGRVIVTAPAEVRRDVVVKATAPTTINLDLPAVK